MLIERITVEGGFLDRLDLSFTSGLNALIGGRGTGKTSIIELIRYCLDIPNYTELSSKRSKEHALAILQDGQVTVTCSEKGNRYTFMRTAGTAAQRLQGAVLPIVFSQTDIESIALQAPGRISLVDSFSQPFGEPTPIAEISAAVASLTAQMQNITREVETLGTQLAEKPSVEAQLAAMAAQEATILQHSEFAPAKQIQLRQLTDQTSAINIAVESSERTASIIEGFLSRLSGILAVPPLLEEWPSSTGFPDPLESVRQEVTGAVSAITVSMQRLRQASQYAKTTAENIRNQKTPLDQAARQLRTEIDNLQQGAGTISRQASQLRDKLNQLISIGTLREERSQRITALQKERGAFLDRLDESSQTTFANRAAIAKRLNQKLNPRIQLKPIRAAQIEGYAASIANALRGGGIKYTEVSVQIAARMSPRELIEVAEQGDVEKLCQTADISRDRALKIITRLRETGGSDILAVRVEDDVEFSLLDGNQYKTIDHLSTGQRCTVVLPIIMEHTDRVIVVDQPEDHLDNAFIADTLIKSLVDRGDNGQIIFSTHNANIPVLGNAIQVVHLGSDGQRAFVQHAGRLENPQTVAAITNVMEGGAEAFQKRAEFYANHRPRV